MAEICKNCNNEITLNFCANCGQKKLKRIDRTYIKDELQYTLLHTNKGFLYTSKMLLRSPGRTTSEFLEGNRVNHYKPILMVFVLAGISLFLSNLFVDANQMVTDQYKNSHPALRNIIIGFFSIFFKFYSFLMISLIPFTALCSWIAFRKWKHNYFEHVVINANLFSTLILFSVIFILPIQYFLVGSPYFFLISILHIGIQMSIAFWMFTQIYSNHAAGDAILRTLVFIALVVTGLVIFGLIIGVATAIHLSSLGVDLKEILTK